MHLKRGIYRFFFSPFDPAVLGFFRIVFGCFILVMLLALFPNWEKYYGPFGLRPIPAGNLSWSVFLWTPTWLSTSLIWWIGLLASISFVLGWKTRFATILLFIVQTSMNHINPMMINGEDLVVRMLLFYSIFAPLDRAYSLDNLQTNRRSYKPVYIWSLRLMQINIALIYAFSLPLKLAADQSWINGEAIYWVMMTSTWNRWPWQDLFYNGILSKIITFSTIAIEGSIPILIWFSKFNLPIAALAVLFHLGLGISLQNVTFFSLSMACSFLLFIPSVNIRKITNRINNALQKNIAVFL